MTSSRVRQSTVAALVVVISVALSACGSDDTASSPGATSSEPASATSDGAADIAADITFAQGMIPHHEQAIEMAEMALDPASGAGDDVRALATAIRDAQDPEIEQMSTWLTDRGESTEMDMSDGHDHSAMEGMVSDADMQTLDAATGTEFDNLWLRLMIAHHDGAIGMAEDELAEGTDAEMRQLAEAIIAGQQAEIDTMSALLGG